jgi:hypothetical protein
MTFTPRGSELKCEFGKVRDDILIRAYILHTSYPNHDIILHATMTSSSASARSSPDISGAPPYILVDYLFFQINLSIGADFSRTNWEAVCQVQSTLVECLFHKIILDKIQWCHSLQGWTKPLITPAMSDALNPGILNPR